MFTKPYRIPLGFLVTGVLWALFSHPIIASFTTRLSPGVTEIIRSCNHLGFVAIASIVLYFEIRKQQRKLAASEEQYRHLFELNPNPMWIFKMSTLQFVKVNKAAIKQYGYTESEFLSMTVKDIRPESEKEKFIEHVFLLEAGKRDHGAWKHLTKEGEELYVSIVNYDMTFNGEYCRLTMATNVTEMILKEERIKAQNAALHEIAWINSHEVRKSLCSVMSLTALLKDTTNELERRQYIEMIDQCTHELDDVLKKTNNRVDELKED